MRSHLLLTLLALVSCRHATAPATMSQPDQNVPYTYPPARQADVVDDYHGVRIADPYRWLEDSDTPESRAWIDAQNVLSHGFLRSHPGWNTIRHRLTTLWNYERFGVPGKVAGRYFFSRNSGLQDQSVMLVADSLQAEPRVLLDPNTLSPDGTVALGASRLSKDGRLLAYALSSSGSDWQVWHVRDVDSGQDLPDQLKWSKFSGVSWSADGLGFYYGRYPEPGPGAALEEANYFHKLYFHRLGTPQSQDLLVYERPDEKEWMFEGEVTHDGRYLVISVSKGTDPTNLVFTKDLSDPNAPVKGLFTTWDGEMYYLGNDGTEFYFKTNLEAPRGRVVAVGLDKPERSHWREVVPQKPETLMAASLLQDRLFLSYLQDAKSLVSMHDTSGKHLGDVALPGIGTASGFGGRRDTDETFFAFTSFNVPSTVMRCDVKSGQVTVFKRPAVSFDPDQMETRQVFYQSRDGTRVPMFLAHKRGISLDGNNPTYLYGYGGFNISLTPWFSVSHLTWMEMGGVVAIPNLRGGGEYGEAWHQAGVKANKQNVFDDFMAAAQWLVDNRYTSPQRLAISGASNGGLLVGACITQRPDLFGAALPDVGVMDMLRFHKFTIGWAWVDDYGSSDNAEEFKVLHAYSPLHNVRAGTRFPATLVTTADHDDRVVPGHSFKFTAALQAAQAGPAPVLIRIETKAGHGAGKPTSKLIEEQTDRWAFLAKVMGMTVPAWPEP